MRRWAVLHAKVAARSLADHLADDGWAGLGLMNWRGTATGGQISSSIQRKQWVIVQARRTAAVHVPPADEDVLPLLVDRRSAPTPPAPPCAKDEGEGTAARTVILDSS
jgi:hypothetical protein